MATIILDSNRYQYRDEDGQHLHTLDGRPLFGTSTVMKVVAKPLTYWASGLAVKEFGCSDPKVLTKIKNKKATPEEIVLMNESAKKKLLEIKSMEIDEYLKLITKAYSAHATSLKDSAEEGVDLHAELERFVKNHMIDSTRIADNVPYNERIKPFIEWTEKNVKRFLWSEMHCYSEKLWIGGIVDCVCELNDGRIAIIDFKSSKEVYVTQKMQIAGYAIQIEENGIYDREGNKIGNLDKKVEVYGVVPFGKENPIPELSSGINIEEYKQGFEFCLGLHKILQNNERQ